MLRCLTTEHKVLLINCRLSSVFNSSFYTSISPVETMSAPLKRASYLFDRILTYNHTSVKITVASTYFCLAHYFLKFYRDFQDLVALIFIVALYSRRWVKTLFNPS